MASQSQALSIEDVTCPICLQILIKPVSLPCKHQLCLACFDYNVKDGETALFCPMCRLRIGSWARSARRNGSLINQERWKVIQDNFPEKVRHRLEKSDDSDDEFEVFRSLALPGEIREEYEKELQKVNEEREKERKAEEELSMQLIEELQTQELHEPTTTKQPTKQFARPKTGALDNYVKRMTEPGHAPGADQRKAATQVRTAAQSTPTTQASSVAQSTPTTQASSVAQSTASRRESSYPYFCYTPSSTGKLVTADMVTKDSYPYIDLPAQKLGEKKAATQSRDNLASAGQGFVGKSTTTMGFDSKQPKKAVPKAASTVTLADLAAPARGQDRLQPEPVKFCLSPAEFKPKPNIKTTNGPETTNSNNQARSRSTKAPSKPTADSSAQNIRNWLVQSAEVEHRRSRSPSEESKDSISKELNYFRPVKVFPRTPTKKEPIVTPVVKPQPQFLEPVNLATLGGSPLLRQRMHEVQQEHHRKVERHSKGCLAMEEDELEASPQQQDSDVEEMSLLDLCNRTGALDGMENCEPPSPPLLPMLPDSDDEDKEDSVVMVTSTPPHGTLHAVAVDFHSELTRSDAACMPADSTCEPTHGSTDFAVSNINVHEWLQTHCNSSQSSGISVTEGGGAPGGGPPVMVEVTQGSDTTGGGDSTFNTSSVINEESTLVYSFSSNLETTYHSQPRIPSEVVISSTNGSVLTISSTSEEMQDISRLDHARSRNSPVKSTNGPFNSPGKYADSPSKSDRSSKSIVDPDVSSSSHQKPPESPIKLANNHRKPTPSSKKLDKSPVRSSKLSHELDQVVTKKPPPGPSRRQAARLKSIESQPADTSTKLGPVMIRSLRSRTISDASDTNSTCSTQNKRPAKQKQQHRAFNRKRQRKKSPDSTIREDMEEDEEQKTDEPSRKIQLRSNDRSGNSGKVTATNSRRRSGISKVSSTSSITSKKNSKQESVSAKLLRNAKSHTTVRVGSETHKNVNNSARVTRSRNRLKRSCVHTQASQGASNKQMLKNGGKMVLVRLQNGRQNPASTNSSKTVRSANKQRHVNKTQPVALHTRSHDQENPSQQRQQSIVMFCEVTSRSTNPLDPEGYALEGLNTRRTCECRVSTCNNCQPALDAAVSQQKSSKQVAFAKLVTGRSKVPLKQVNQRRKTVVTKWDLTRDNEGRLRYRGVKENNRRNTLGSNRTRQAVANSSCGESSRGTSVKRGGTNSRDSARGASVSSESKSSSGSEDKDFLLAKKLQESFDREARLRLNSLRHEGGDDPYPLRRKRTRRGND